MKVLVTGAHGFIGSWTAKHLVDEGYSPICFDRRRRGPYDYPTGSDLFLGDMTDETAVFEAMAHSEAFIHLAGVLGTQETIQYPKPAALSNLMGGLNVLEAAARYGVPGVYIGVGNHWMNNTYSISKTMVERFVDMFNANRGTTVNVVRAMNAYGPGQSVAAPYGDSKVRKITPSFACRAILGHDIEIYGDGSQISDMVWVGDVARTLVAAMEHAVDGKVAPQVIERANILVGIAIVENALDQTASYSYDAANNLLSLTDPNNQIHSFTYDLAGRLTAVEKDGVVVEQYQYDANGNRTSETNAHFGISRTLHPHH